MTQDTKQGFFKNHADTLAIIGVNIAIAAILTTMWVSNSNRVDACNARIDTSNTRIDATLARVDATMSRVDATYQIIVELLKEGRK